MNKVKYELELQLTREAVCLCLSSSCQDLNDETECLMFLFTMKTHACCCHLFKVRNSGPAESSMSLQAKMFVHKHSVVQKKAT